MRVKKRRHAFGVREASAIYTTKVQRPKLNLNLLHYLRVRNQQQQHIFAQVACHARNADTIYTQSCRPRMHMCAVSGNIETIYRRALRAIYALTRIMSPDVRIDWPHFFHIRNFRPTAQTQPHII